MLGLCELNHKHGSRATEHRVPAPLPSLTWLAKQYHEKNTPPLTHPLSQQFSSLMLICRVCGGPTAPNYITGLHLACSPDPTAAPLPLSRQLGEEKQALLFCSGSLHWSSAWGWSDWSSWRFPSSNYWPALLCSSEQQYDEMNRCTCASHHLYDCSNGTLEIRHIQPEEECYKTLFLKTLQLKWDCDLQTLTHASVACQ